MRKSKVLDHSGRFQMKPVIDTQSLVLAADRISRQQFRQCYNCVLTAWYGLPVAMQEELERFRYRLHVELASWHPGERPLQWHAYCEELNSVCVKYLQMNLFAN
jgi:hypothetical protein